ncbi:MAG TPA: polyprenol monophosphomannose synthase [Candidatus Saccharimonadales bacterium]|nr:polyprenol monophosphomannose synthase [Candidatus Saccharimonadales bacterium]
MIDLSIVVPTFNEGENVAVVAARVRHAMDGHSYELIFVDDCTDDTPAALERLAQTDRNVRFLHRDGVRGLGAAVLLGMHAAQGWAVAEMDGDLQHPPELLPQMLAGLSGADIVIASRFVGGGSVEGLNAYRRLVSLSARSLGRWALPRLRGISDPTGGFFALRRSVIADIEVRPIGWRVLIEILARGRYERVIEIPYRFAPRHAGISKFSVAETASYLRQLGRLFWDSRIRRLSS